MFDNFGNTLPAQVLTPEIYWAAQPKLVRETMQKVMGSGEPAWTAGRSLAIQGYIIDPAIMILGWNPVLVMATRLSDRLPFVQSVAREPLPGRIKSSLDALDYPAVDKPAPPVDLTGLVDQTMVVKDKDGNVLSSTPNLLFSLNGLNYFAPGPGCYGPHGVLVQDGKDYTEAGVSYKAVVTNVMMGLTQVFLTTKVS